MAGATDLKELIDAMLLSSATGFILTAWHRRSSPAAEAAIKYYLLGALANSAMLMGVAFLFGLAGGTTLDALSADLPSGGLVVVAGAGLVVLGIACCSSESGPLDVARTSAAGRIRSGADRARL